MSATQKECTLKEAYESVPLYQKVMISKLSGQHFHPTRFECILNLICPKCEHLPVTTWTHTSVTELVDAAQQLSEETCQRTILAIFKCANCSEVRRTYMLNVEILRVKVRGGPTGVVMTHKIVSVTKAGQWPKPNVKIETILSDFLGKEDTKLFRKSILSREQSHGIGALSYLRRVIDSRVARHRADVIADGMASEDVKIDDQLWKTLPFEQKMDRLRSALPPYVIANGGHNVYALIYGKCSDGLHSQDENGCLAIFDELRPIFEHLPEMADFTAKQQEHSKRVAQLTTPRPQSGK